MNNRQKVLLLVLLAAVLGILLITVYLPPFGGLRPKALQARDISDMRQIAMACAVFAENHEGSYPTSLVDLFSPELEIFSNFESASSIFIQGTDSLSADDLPNLMELTDWIYIPGHSSDSPGDSIVLFFPQGSDKNKETDFALAITVDGSAITCSSSELIRHLNRTFQDLHRYRPPDSQLR